MAVYTVIVNPSLGELKFFGLAFIYNALHLKWKVIRHERFEYCYILLFLVHMFHYIKYSACYINSVGRVSVVKNVNSKIVKRFFLDNTHHTCTADVSHTRAGFLRHLRGAARQG